MARVLLGVSGGIAAYKALELVRLATGAGHTVRVIQTPASRRFVGTASFAALSGAPVLSSEFERDPAGGVFPGEARPAHEPLSHVELAARADVYVIAPASANTIAKLAHGLADNLLCSCALAAQCPLVLAPAMNSRMYEHPATQANLELLRGRGAHVIPPTVGRLASPGEHGLGRLAEPAAILEALGPLIAASRAGARRDGGGRRGRPATRAPEPRDGRSADSRAPSPAEGASSPAASPPSPAAGVWRGLRVLVSAGGTREPIDSVRFIANSSSGRMGLALAEAAARRGARVTVVAANVALARPDRVAWRSVGSAAELKESLEEEFDGCDVLLMAAAVADFRPAEPVEGKLRKADRARLELVLEPTEDVLRGLASRRRPGQTLVGFAAEHGPGAVEQGHEKLRSKGLDAVVVNDISRPDIGFDVDFNEVTILTRGHERRVSRAPKREIAEAILDTVQALREQLVWTEAT
jgi:phosphopantothenoylcysteine decarboxylase/phosphopantothenate--cysteine ligase